MVVEVVVVVVLGTYAASLIAGDSRIQQTLLGNFQQNTGRLIHLCIIANENYSLESLTGSLQTRLSRYQNKKKFRIHSIHLNLFYPFTEVLNPGIFVVDLKGDFHFHPAPNLECATIDDLKSFINRVQEISSKISDMGSINIWPCLPIRKHRACNFCISKANIAHVYSIQKEISRMATDSLYHLQTHKLHIVISYSSVRRSKHIKRYGIIDRFFFRSENGIMHPNELYPNVGFITVMLNYLQSHIMLQIQKDIFEKIEEVRERERRAEEKKYRARKEERIDEILAEFDEIIHKLFPSNKKGRAK